LLSECRIYFKSDNEFFHQCVCIMTEWCSQPLQQETKQQTSRLRTST